MTTDIQRIEPGTRMSMAVAHGPLVFTAGQVAKETAGGSVADQTREILGLVDGLLAKAGTDKTRLISASIWLTDISTFQEMNGVWDAWVAPGCAPARATVEAKLAAPQYKVEIAVVAAR